jgi:hypothetical protein
MREMNSLPTSPRALASDYYLTNFKFLVEWIFAHYQDLLSEEELQFITCFQSLEHNSQCLFVRLSSRKGQLFRADKLRYAELESLELAAKQLIDTDLIKTNSLLTVAEVANLLTKTELINLFPAELNGHKHQRKEFLFQLLAEKYQDAMQWRDWTKQQLGDVYHLTGQEIVRNFLLLFFGNAYQDLTEFVLQDLGLFRYENYLIDHQHRIFKTRDELQQYQLIVSLRERLATAVLLEELITVAEQLPAALNTPSLEHRCARLCNQLAYEFERWEQHTIATSLYQRSHLPPARERRVRLLEKQGDFNAAWQLLSEMLCNPVNEHELQIAERMAPRLAKKHSLSFNKKIYSPIAEKFLVLPRLVNDLGESLCVEEIVKLHIGTPNQPCCYVENQLLSGLFGLWLWPEMFRSINGAFANPFQSAPLDMYEASFVTNRPQIQLLWELLESGTYHEHIRNIWQHKNGIANHFVNWNFFNEYILELALACIPASHLKLIFGRMLFDIKNNLSGLPDLIQFFPEEKNYRMIEVKGPGDRIQDNQKRWLDFFASHHIPAEVIYVSWQ